MTEETRTCPACGQPASVQAKYCPECGTAMNAPWAAPEVQTEDESAPTNREPQRAAAPEPAPTAARSRRPLILLMAVLALLVAGGITGAVIASTPSDTSKRDTERASAPATTAPVTNQPEDTDGDGTPDSSDPDPYASNDTSADDTADNDLESSPSGDEDTTEPDEADGRDTAETNVRVGDAAADDDVTFKVTSLQTVQSIPVDEYSDPIVRKPGTKLIRADITWKNNTNAPLDIFCGQEPAILLDQDQRNFQPRDVTLDIAGNETCGDELQPGFKQSVTLAFQIPADSKTLGLILWNKDAEDDFDGSSSSIFFEK